MATEGVNAALNVGAGAVFAGGVGEGDDAGDGFAGNDVSLLVFTLGGFFFGDVCGITIWSDVRIAEAGGGVE